MHKKKIVTCLDVRGGVLTKGEKFLGNMDIGDPIEAAREYSAQGADEIVFYDFTATHEGRGTMLDMAAKVAAAINVPFSIGGGIKSLDDFRAALGAGANKVHINTAAVRTPGLVAEAAREFPNQVVLSMDILTVEKGGSVPSGFEVVVDGGRTRTGLDAVEWAARGEGYGACEVVLNSIDADGTREGFNVPLTRAVALAVGVPVVASGGGGTIRHIYDVLTEGRATSALVASMLHYGEYTVGAIKDGLREMGLKI